MYRREIILARIISIVVTLRRPFPQIAGLNRVSFAHYHIRLNESIDWQLNRDTLPPLFCDKRRFFLQAPHGNTGLANPFQSTDQGIAAWFHDRLTPAFVNVLRALTEFGSSEWIAIVLFALVLFFVRKRSWPSLVILIVAVPGGMLLNEWLKLLVHRHRPFVEGPFVDWSSYSFASGHTMGATLLYGQLLLFLLPLLKGRHLRHICVFGAAFLVVLVGFSRIALGAHFLTDAGRNYLRKCLVAVVHGSWKVDGAKDHCVSDVSPACAELHR